MPKRAQKKSALTQKEKKEVTAIAKRVVHVAEPLHYVDEYSTGTEITSTATFLDLTDAITQGDGNVRRTGDTVALRSLRFHGTFNRNAGTQDTYDFDHIRMVLFKWMPDNSVDTPSEGALLYDSGADDINAPIELDPVERRKIRVLEDRRILLGARYAATNPVDVNIPAVKDLSFRKYGKQLGRVHYNGSAVTGSGHIYLMLIGSRASGVNASTLRFHATFHFDP